MIGKFPDRSQKYIGTIIQQFNRQDFSNLILPRSWRTFGQQQQINQFPYPFEIFIEQFYKNFIDSQFDQFWQNLKEKYALEVIANHPYQKLQQLVLIKIPQDMSQKLSCLEEILDKILIIDKKQNFKFDELQEIQCLIPESLVAQVIGTAGKQIEQFNFNSGSKIIIDKASQNAEKRIVRISGFQQLLNLTHILGTTQQILKAFQQIYQFIDHTIFKLQQNKKQFMSQKQPVNKQFMVGKIVVEQKAIHAISGENGCQIKEIEKKYQVQIMISQEKDCCYLYPNEFVCKIQGDLDQIALASLEIIEKLYKFSKQLQKQFEDPDEPILKILVINKLIPKLLGKQGNQIKEIAYQAGGPSIKIDERRPQKEYKNIEIPIIIKGSLEAQQDAVFFQKRYKFGDFLQHFNFQQEEIPAYIQKTWRLQSKSRSISNAKSSQSSYSSSSCSRSRSRSRNSKSSYSSYSSSSRSSNSSSSSSSSSSRSKSYSSRSSSKTSVNSQDKKKQLIQNNDTACTKNNLALAFEGNHFGNNKLINENQSAGKIQIQLSLLPNQNQIEEQNQPLIFSKTKEANNAINTEISIQAQQQQNLVINERREISKSQQQPEVRQELIQKSQSMNKSLDNGVQNKVVQTTLNISKDFAFKNYKKQDNDFIQFSTLIPIENYEQLSALISKYQEELYEKFGAKIIADNDQRVSFSNDEQECFLMKVLGEQGQCVDAFCFIMNQFVKQL